MSYQSSSIPNTINDWHVTSLLGWACPIKEFKLVRQQFVAVLRFRFNGSQMI